MNPLTPLTSENYSNGNINDLNLDDKIVAYSCGSNCWKMIKLSTMLNHGLLYDIYTSENESWDITVIVCPKTLYSCVFNGKCKYIEYKDNIMILENNENTFEIITDEINKYQVYIGYVSSLLLLYPDIMYITLSENYTYKYKIHNEKLPQNIINPYTLVYLISYKSKHTGKHKKYIIIGHDADEKDITGYDLRKSKFIEYLMTIKKKVRERNGYIVPILFHYAQQFYPNSKYINLKE